MSDNYVTPLDGSEIVGLTDNDGEDFDFAIVGKVGLDDKVYAILLPLDARLEGGAAIFCVCSQGEEDAFVTLDDEDEYDRVAEFWNRTMDEKEDDIN